MGCKCYKGVCDVQGKDDILVERLRRLHHRQGGQSSQEVHMEESPQGYHGDENPQVNQNS